MTAAAANGDAQQQQAAANTPSETTTRRAVVTQSAMQGDTQSSEGEDSGETTDFVNRGLQHWEETRASWLSNTEDSSSADKTAIPVDVDEIIDLIFSQRWRDPDASVGRFAQAVPLPQMVDILVDLWEAEGLDI